MMRRRAERMVCRPIRSVLAIVGLLSTVLAAPGCYVYEPLAAPAPDGRRVVALQLTDRGKLELADRLGGSVSRVEGRLVNRTDSTLLLAVQDAIMDRGSRVRWEGEVVELPEIYVNRVMERRLSKWRTGLLVGALVGGAAVLLTTDLGGVPGDGLDNRPPDDGAQTSVFVIPFLRVRLP